MKRTNFTRLLIFLLCLPMTMLFGQSKQINWQITTIQSQLNNAPLEGSSNGKTIALPMPEGADEQVEIWESPVISTEMSALYPSIKTYIVRGVNDKELFGRVMISNIGFHGTIMNNKGRVVIERVGVDNNSYKVAVAPTQAFECRTPGGNFKDNGGDRTYSNGATLRNYDFAAVTTPEFVAGNGGTNAAANLIVAQHINSLNVLYEKELSIRFTLLTPHNSPTAIANQDLNAVQTILTAQFPGGYDLGHAFHHTSAGGGSGLAGLGIVCSSGSKGRGWSGANPSNGALFMDIFYHEVAHQFNAPHTYNGTGSSCTAQISTISAYEIGSGTTIMSYSGSCGVGQNIGESDLRFHTHSLEAMSSFASGSGNCATNTATGNTPPVVNANPSGGTYSIPKSTPFELTGSGADANGDVIQYCWEQYNEDGIGAPTQGMIGATAGASTLAPLFRCYPVTSSLTRTFPALSYILSNTPYDFEPLPSVARTLNFRLTGRDNRVGGGGIHCSAVAVNVINTATPFAVTSQNAATTWAANGSNTATVTWDVAGTTAAPISCANVTILFSTDGGVTFPNVLVASTPNNGSATFTIPSYPTTVGRVKVKCADGNIFFDINNDNITITSSCTAEAASISPATAVSAPPADAALNFNLTPQYGAIITPFTGSITAASPASSLFLTASPCSNFGANLTNYVAYTFQVSVAGTYIFNRTVGSNLVMGLFNTAFVPSSPCTNFIAGSTNNLTASISATLNPNLIYVFVVSTFNTGTPALPAPYTINVTPPAGGGIFSGIPNPGATFLYSYVIVNTITNTVVGIQAGSSSAAAAVNMTAAGTYPAGTYQVYGLSHSNTTTLASLQGTYVGQPFTTLQSALALLTFCGDLSSNSKPVTITAPSCTPPTVSTQPAPTTTVCAGASVALTVAATGGTPAYTYQWKKGAANVVNSASITGATTATLTINPTTTADAGTYTCVITDMASCSVTSANAVVTINPSPSAFNVTGSGAYCTGGTGVAVGLSSSVSGINYQLKDGASDVGAPVAGTGAVISFGNQTTATTYTVVATVAATGCTATMTGNAVVTINPLPAAFAVTGGGAYCAGGTGVPVGLANSVSTVSYQLKNGATNVSTLGGTGAALAFGNQTAAGTYTIVATTIATTCMATMTGSAVVTINPLPTFTAAPTNPTSCSSSNGSIALNGLTASTNYTVAYTFNGTPVAAAAFTSNATGTITLPSLAAGAYTNIIVTNVATTCASAAGSTNLVAPSAPTSAVLAGTTAICAGQSANLTVTVTGGVSPYNVVYTANAVNQTPVTGYVSGSNIPVSPVATTTYTLVSVTDANGCAGTGLSGTATVTVNPIPTFTAAGTNPTSCTTPNGSIALSGLAASTSYSVTYTLLGTPTTTTLASNASGVLTISGLVAGSYSNIRVTLAGCQSTAAALVLAAPGGPTTSVLAGTTAICAGQSANLTVTVTGGVSPYNVVYAANAVNQTPVTGYVSGSNISVTPSVTTTYTLVGVTDAAGCVSAGLSGSPVVTVTPIPTFTVASTNPTSCISNNGSITLNGLTASTTYSVTYTLGGTPTTASLTSTAGGSITIGSLAAGSYSNIRVTLATCQSAAATANLVAPSAPTSAVLAGTSAICAGQNTNLTVTITGGTSPYNVVYAANAVNQTPVTGYVSSSNISVTPAATTTYTLVSVTDAAGCAGTGLSGTATVTVNQVPTVAAAGSAQTICTGTAATLAANAPVSGTGAWSVVSGPNTATSQFAAVAVNNTTFTPTAAGVYTLRWTISTAAPCTPSTSDVVITVNAAPTSTNGGNKSVCLNTTTTGLGGNTPAVGVGTWTSNSGGAFAPNATTANATFTPAVGFTGTAILTWTVVNAPCANATSTLNVVVNALSTAMISGGGTICAGGTASTITFTGAGGTTPYTFTYQINGGANQTVSTVGAATTATVTASNTATQVYTLVSVNNGSSCPQNQAGTATSTVNPIPTFTVASTNPTSCISNNGSITLNGLTASTTYSVSYTLGGTPTTASLTSTAGGSITIGSLAAGSYTNITATLASCPSAAATANLVAPSAPTSAVLAGTAPICAGSSTNLTATIVGGTSPYTLVYSNGTNQTVSSYVSGASITVAPIATTTYTLVSVTDAVGCAGTGLSGSAVVTVNQVPTVSAAGSAQTICTGTAATLAANAPVNGTGAWSVVSGPNTATSQFAAVAVNNTTFTPTAAGVYTLRWTISTAAPCTPSTSDVVITVNAASTVANAGADLTACSSGSTIMAANTPTAGTGAWTIIAGPNTSTAQLSSTSTANALFTPTAVGAYTLRWTITGVAPCASASSDDVVVTVSATSCASIANTGGTIAANLPLITDPCTCIGNNIFSEDVIITSFPGEIWTVAAGTTLLDPATMTAYAVGVQFTQLPGAPNALGQVEYKLNGRHLSGVGYVLKAVSASYAGAAPLTQSNTCTSTPSGGAMVCKGNVNLSLPANCSLKVTADLVLNTPATPNQQVVILNGTNPLPSTTLNATHVGKTYTVKVIDGCDGTGNSCWATLILEDKQAPIITLCADKTVSCSDLVGESTSSKNFTSQGPLGVITAPKVEECFDKTLPTLTYTDVVSDLPCVVGSAYITKKIVRTYSATDAYGNKATCVQNISFERPNLTGATLTAVKKQFNCNATFAKDANGNPTAAAAGRPVFNLAGGGVAQVSDACDLSVTYTDAKAPICGGGFEITRNWLVIDACNGVVFPATQLIEIKDLTEPTITSAVPNITISTSATDCLSDVELTIPTTDDNCDKNVKITANVSGTGFAVIGNKVRIKGLPVGNYALVWTATDACGNFTNVPQNITVKDLIAPVVVCDLNTKIALTSDGKATLLAEDVDDGSLDNCCLDINTFEIKRAADADSTYSKSLTFTCADAAVMVALRVKDCNLNSNVCMVNVLVEDKLPPVIFAKNNAVECGSDVAATAWLDANKPTQKLTLADYPTANNAGWYDNCGGTVNFTDQKGIDNCGNGTFSRTWTVTDAKGLTSSTVQRFVSINKSAYSVTFPADVVLTTPADCKDFNLTPTALSSKPTITILNNTCPLVGLDYTDEVFDIVGDTICQKILRKWKSLNWCAPAGSLNGGATLLPNNPNGVTATLDAINKGFFQYTQVIKVIDKVGPVLGTPKTPKLSPVGKECKVDLEIAKIDVSDCGTPSVSWAIIGFNNVELKKGTSFPIQYTFLENQFGTTTVRYTATDNCGNYSSTDQIIKVADVKKPTPICHNGLSIEIMQTKMVMLDAKVVDAGSYDNCTAQGKLKFKIQVPAPNPAAVPTINPDTMKTFYTFTCPPAGTIPDPANPNAYVISVALWVGDEAGNWDYCETYVIVEDNIDVCGYNPIQMKPLDGEVKTEKSANVENVMLKLDGTKKMDIFSSVTGKYQFKDLPIVGQYTVVPEKDVYPMNGVSTLDLVLMSKHILATQPIVSPYQLIAADVNKSGTVSTADIVELRKMILGIQSNFSKNTSWRFVDKAFAFPANVNPLTSNFPEKIDLNGLSSTAKADFVAVKVGDINGNAITNSQVLSTGRGKNTFKVESQDQSFKTGEEVRMNFRSNDITNINGYQFTFEFDKNNLELLDIQGDKENFAVVENGVITTSAVTADNTNDDLFSFVFKAKRNGSLSKNVKLTSSVTPSEAYTKEGEAMNVNLNFNTARLEAFELHQNRPNPFNEATIISFNLPQQGKAILSINDASGRVVKLIENDFAKGYNEVKISKNELGTSGVFYYQLEQNGQKATRKLVVIE